MHDHCDVPADRDGDEDGEREHYGQRFGKPADGEPDGHGFCSQRRKFFGYHVDKFCQHDGRAADELYGKRDANGRVQPSGDRDMPRSAPGSELLGDAGRIDTDWSGCNDGDGDGDDHGTLDAGAQREAPVDRSADGRTGTRVAEGTGTAGAANAGQPVGEKEAASAVDSRSGAIAVSAGGRGLLGASDEFRE